MGHFTVQPTYIKLRHLLAFILATSRHSKPALDLICPPAISPGKRGKHHLITFLISLTNVIFFPRSLSFKKHM